MHTVTLPLSGSEPPYLAVECHGDGTATLYDPGDTLPPDMAPMPMPRLLTPAEFRARLTDAELAGITMLAYSGTGDAPAQVLLAKVSTASEGIDLDSASVRAGLDYLVGRGRLTAARVAEILG